MFNSQKIHILCTSTSVHCTYHSAVLCTGVELNNSRREYIFITSALHIAEFMQELSMTDFCYDAILNYETRCASLLAHRLLASVS